MTDHTDLIERLRKGYEYGDSGVVLEAANALQAAQAEIERLENRIEDLTSEEHSIPELRQQIAESFEEKQKAWKCIAGHQMAIKNLLADRDQALARLAELTKQEPVAAQIRVAIASESGWSDWREINLSDADREYRNGVETRKLYAAAGASPLTDTAAIDAGCRYITPLLTQGASPVQPSQGLQSVADALTIEQLNDKVERLMAVQPSQAVEVSKQDIYDIAHRKATRYVCTAAPSDVMYGFSEMHLLDFVAAINAKESGK